MAAILRLHTSARAMLSLKCSHRSIKRGLQSRLFTGLLSCYDGAFENLPGSRTLTGLTKALGSPLDTAGSPIIAVILQSTPINARRRLFSWQPVCPGAIRLCRGPRFDLPARDRRRPRPNHHLAGSSPRRVRRQPIRPAPRALG
jgi:hypothetical protein